LQVHERQFQAISEDQPGLVWREFAKERWPHYEKWFSHFEGPTRPTWLECTRKLREYMPEIVPLYEDLVELGGGGDKFGRFLSLWCPPAYMAGCSQTAWTKGAPALLRNYDYSPSLFEAVLIRTQWNQTGVMASSDCLWGVLDGMNTHGLAVSLAFGGDTTVGEGFGIPLVLRYILQTCASVREGVAVLKRVPIHMSYNVLLVDKKGKFATVHVSPDRQTVETRKAASTNHQEKVRWWRHALATQSVERAEVLESQLPRCDVESEAVQVFLDAPIFSSAYSRGFGTLYTAAWHPASGEVTLYWPNSSWHQSFANFLPAIRTVHYVTPGVALGTKM